MILSNFEERKEQYGLPKIKRGLIVYQHSKKYKKFFPNHIKYGFAPTKLECEEAKTGMQQLKVLRMVGKGSVRKIAFQIGTEQKSNWEFVLLLTSRIASLQSVSFVFYEDEIKLTDQQALKQLFKRFFKQNKRVLFLKVSFEEGSMLFNLDLKPFSFLHNIKEINISYSNYWENNLFYSATALTNTLENGYKRGVWQQIKSQHFSFEIDTQGFESLDFFTQFLSQLTKLHDLTKEIKTEFSFQISLGALYEQNLADFYQTMKNISNIRKLSIKENPHNIISLLNLVKNNNIQSLEISLKENTGQKELFLTNYPDLLKEMSSLKTLSVNIDYFPTRECFISFTKNIGKLTQLTKLRLYFFKVNWFVDEVLLDLSNSLRKLPNIQEFALRIDSNARLNSEIFVLTCYKSLAESLGDLKNLRSLYLNIGNFADSRVDDDEFMKCLGNSLKKMENLKNLMIDVQANKNNRDSGIFHLSKSFSLMKNLERVNLRFSIREGISSEALLNLFHKLSMIKHLFDLSISLRVKEVNVQVAQQLFKYLSSMKSLGVLNIAFNPCDTQSELGLQMIYVTVQNLFSKLDSTCLI